MQGLISGEATMAVAIGTVVVWWMREIGKLTATDKVWMRLLGVLILVLFAGAGWFFLSPKYVGTTHHEPISQSQRLRTPAESQTPQTEPPASPPAP